MNQEYRDLLIKKVTNNLLADEGKTLSLEGAALVWTVNIGNPQEKPCAFFRYGNSAIALVDEVIPVRQSSTYRHNLFAHTDSPTKLDQAILRRFMTRRGYTLEEKAE